MPAALAMTSALNAVVTALPCAKHNAAKTASSVGAAALATTTSVTHEHQGSGLPIADRACKMNMYWNWYTTDACFIHKSWHIYNTAQFVGACFGVILLVTIVEFLRRCQREYDRHIIRQHLVAQANSISGQIKMLGGSGVCVGAGLPVKRGFRGAVEGRGLKFRPSVGRQIVRAGIYGLIFGLGYFLMLLVMYYNGYIFFCMIIGAILGNFLFGWDSMTVGGKQEDQSCC